MVTPSVVSFPGDARVHIGLEVADLDRSLAFYRVLLGEEPVKIRPGYAKFEPRDPSVNLSLNENPSRRSGPPAGAGHFGVQVKSTARVEETAARLAEAGISTRFERNSACCYAVQDKVWARDPDGNPWEVFVVTERDIPERSAGVTGCCVSTASSPAAGPATTAGGE